MKRITVKDIFIIGGASVIANLIINIIFSL